MDTEYWDSRYSSGGNSGNGSRGDHARYKSTYINGIIRSFPIETINELGHGDGYQLSLMEGDFKYYGYDISSFIRNKLIEEYKDNSRYTFLDSLDTMQKADLALSLDVLYHITDQKEWQEYINRLFELGKYVLIYAQDMDKRGQSHVVSRKFTKYIDDNITTHHMIEREDGWHEDVAFYLYKETKYGR